MNQDVTTMRRALVSVYDKTGLEELAHELHAAHVEIVSTGSTAETIRRAGIPVTPVEDVTGFPECLDGRVKTLHPMIHAGILADSRKPEHLAQLSQLAVEAFDLVVVNLYPFSDTVASGASEDECIEQIDIGGPTMVRAAAKNYPSVAVVTRPEQYDELIAAVQKGGFTLQQRRKLALAAFRHTAAYDVAVAEWLGRHTEGTADDAHSSQLPTWRGRTFTRLDVLRYGENPHQSAALYLDDAAEDGLARARQLHGKQMSYNNYTDGDAAWRAAWDHHQPCVAVIKHANPCGIAISTESIADAHRRAHACDPLSAFGGIIASNREVSVEMAHTISGIFTEAVIAPSYEDGALDILQQKKNLRVLLCPPSQPQMVETKEITGGLLVQERDTFQASGDNPERWTLVAGDSADSATLRDLEFAWRSVRAVKSNAILLAHHGATVGIGMGQVNRVDAAKLAVERANTLGGEDNQRAQGAVAASDAFFPFPDGFQILADAGVTAVVQPGGSIRDDEVITAAKDAGVTMYLTGARHFAH